jgi:hypothetical protein
MEFSKAYRGINFRWEYVWLCFSINWRNWYVGISIDWLEYVKLKKWRRVNFNLLFLCFSMELFSKGYWDGCIRKPGLRIPINEIKEN